MGSGSWTSTSFADYTTTTKGVTLDSLGAIDASLSNQELFKARRLNEDLNPYKVMRECRDSEEHPNTIPIILGLDVTGSMGQAAVEVAKKLNVIMTELYDSIKDIEFSIMGIGDLYCDDVPIQISQFESDIRIAEHLDKVYFEFGGGGNNFESYTVAWYMGLRHCDLDCWKRNKKGIIITIGDERCNPYLEKKKINKFVGDTVQADIETPELYKEVVEHFDVYHINVEHGSNWDTLNIIKSWEFMGDHFRICNLDDISRIIIDIIKTASVESETNYSMSNNEISW